VPYLRNRLPRHEPVDAERVRKLIAQLDDERFTVRERAMKELGQVGDAAEPLLREQRAATASPEVGQRIDELLEGLVHGTGDADALRARRAVEVLERIGTPEARSALAEVAAGTSGAKLKSHARAALHRLGADAPPAGQ
jgi:HEAT repeat protein